MRQIFPSLHDQTALTIANGTGLLIEPIILDLKKVNVSERIWLGPISGSSAVLLKVIYTDLATKEVVASPTFFARAEAFGGMATFGAMDNVMLTRIVNDACDYTKANR